MTISVTPATVEVEKTVIYLTGLFMYREERAGDHSVRAFLKDFDNGSADFNACTGSYRINICYPDGRQIYFADNAGIMRWFIRDTGFYTSLADAAPLKRTPNYAAIVQVLCMAYGRIHGTDTVIQEVRRSDLHKYYVVEQGSLAEKEKGLLPMWQLPGRPDELERQMRRFANAVSGCEGIACTVTGGADSRLVLAHMLHNGMNPLLDITGQNTDPDVIIAKKIAERLGKDLLHVTDEPETANWIDSAIRAADGLTGVCGIYRLYKKAARLQKEGIVLECGGGGGEFYKNSSINLDYPFYGGQPRWNHFMRIKSILFDLPLSILGQNTVEIAESMKERELRYLSAYTGGTKARSYLSAYYDILQEGGSASWCMNSRFYIPYVPLMERNVTALAFHMNPYKMNGLAFHRDQISRFCPEIKDIKTDHALTLDSKRRHIESLKLLQYWADAGIRMTLRRNRTDVRVDACFHEGLSSPQYDAALNRCKTLGIIAPDITDLPMGIADRVFAVGTML